MLPPTTIPELGYGSLCEYVRTYRRILNIDQDDLGKAAHLSRISIMSIERGKSIPRFDRALLIIRALQNEGAPPFRLEWAIHGLEVDLGLNND